MIRTIPTFQFYFSINKKIYKLYVRFAEITREVLKETQNEEEGGIDLLTASEKNL